jgi:hypothetical protein
VWRHLCRMSPFGRNESRTAMPETLLRHLTPELWQTETSASQHCRREARRLGDTPPARALVATAEHADAALAEMRNLEVVQTGAKPGIGVLVGKFFSDVRESVADRMLTSERSYRGTLLGMRHGVDVVKLMLESARKEGRDELVQFFERWLQRRVPLVEAAANELRWFAERADQALAPAKGMGATKSRGAHEHHAS